MSITVTFSLRLTSMRRSMLALSHFLTVERSALHSASGMRIVPFLVCTMA